MWATGSRWRKWIQIPVSTLLSTEWSRLSLETRKLALDRGITERRLLWISPSRICLFRKNRWESDKTLSYSTTALLKEINLLSRASWWNGQDTRSIRALITSARERTLRVTLAWRSPMVGVSKMYVTSSVSCHSHEVPPSQLSVWMPWMTGRTRVGLRSKVWTILLCLLSTRSHFWSAYALSILPSARTRLGSGNSRLAIELLIVPLPRTSINLTLCQRLRIRTHGSQGSASCPQPSITPSSART